MFVLPFFLLLFSLWTFFFAFVLQISMLELERDPDWWYVAFNLYILLQNGCWDFHEQMAWLSKGDYIMILISNNKWPVTDSNNNFS